MHVTGRDRVCLRADGAGNWTDADGTPLPALQGCVDVDLSGSPFTNTLPIRRLGDNLRARQEIRVTYIDLPKLDGYALAGRAKADPAIRDIPLVAVTALAMVGDRERAIRAGFDGYLAKPIEPETFIQEIERYLPAHGGPIGRG